MTEDLTTRSRREQVHGAGANPDPVNVAVIDTGVRQADFLSAFDSAVKDRLLTLTCYDLTTTTNADRWKKPVHGIDSFGHGTLVAGIIVQIACAVQ